MKWTKEPKNLGYATKCGPLEGFVRQDENKNWEWWTTAFSKSNYGTVATCQKAKTAVEKCMRKLATQMLTDLKRN